MLDFLVRDDRDSVEGKSKGYKPKLNRIPTIGQDTILILVSYTWAIMASPITMRGGAAW